MGARQPLRLLRLLRTVAPRGLAAYVALYLSTLVGGPIVDARFAGATGPVRHVETEQSAACPVHDHDACQVCRTVRALSVPAAPVLVVVQVRTVITTTRPDTDAPAPHRLDPSQSPRAPPLS